MKIILLAALLSTSTYIRPGSIDDLYNFVDFAIAKKHCANPTYDRKALEKNITRLRAAYNVDDKSYADIVHVRTRMADISADQNSYVYCKKVNETFDSYDPAYLRKVGVID